MLLQTAVETADQRVISFFFLGNVFEVENMFIWLGSPNNNSSCPEKLEKWAPNLAKA